MLKLVKVFMCSQSMAYAAVTKLSSEDLLALQNATNFHKISAKKDLPKEIVMILEKQEKMADVDEYWEKTDSVSSSNPVFKHFIWAYASDDYYVIHYEKGGYVYQLGFLVIKIEKNTKKPIMVWYGTGRNLFVDKQNKLNNLDEFIAALKNNKIDEDPSATKYIK